MNAVRVAAADDAGLDWGEGHAAIGRYVRALAALGPDGALENDRFEIAALQLTDRTFPIVIPTGDQHCWLTSLTTTYGKAARDEIARDLTGAEALAYRLASQAGEALLRATAADHAVFVNHLLFSTSLYGGWVGADLASALGALRQAYPDRAIVWRSLNGPDHPALLAALREAGAKLIPSRIIWRLDDPADQWARRTDVKADLRLAAAHGLKIEDLPQPSADDLTRIRQLYLDIYVAKYSDANPVYRPALFAAAVESGVLGLQVVRGPDGQIQAFAADHAYEGMLCSPMLGHDRGEPQALGLYRLAMSLSVQSALRQGLAVNYSAGAAAFKRHRGATPALEYAAVIDAHLPLRRRLGYGLLERALGAMAPSLERIATR